MVCFQWQESTAIWHGSCLFLIDGYRTSICMATHDPRFARHAERAFHLFDGKVVSEIELENLEEEVETSPC